MAGAGFAGWIIIYFVTTVLTNATGFGFPFATLLTSHIVRGVSIVVLPVAIAALYWMHLKGAWRSFFVLTSFALYLNVLVLVLLLFLKVPAMVATAPTQTSPAFVVTHLIIIVLFVVLGRAAVKGFRAERAAMAG